MSFDQVIVLVAVASSVVYALGRLVRFLRTFGDRPSDPSTPSCGTGCAGCAALQDGGGCHATDGHALVPKDGFDLPDVPTPRTPTRE